VASVLGAWQGDADTGSAGGSTRDTTRNHRRLLLAGELLVLAYRHFFLGDGRWCRGWHGVWRSVLEFVPTFLTWNPEPYRCWLLHVWCFCLTGAAIYMYLPGPHYDPPSKEKLKLLMDVIQLLSSLAIYFLLMEYSFGQLDRAPYLCLLLKAKKTWILLFTNCIAIHL
jgi:hypothetical protein